MDSFVLKALVAGALVVPQAVAQDNFATTVLYSPQAAVGGEFGRATCVVDIDRDGFHDVVALESGAFVDGLISAGRGWVFFGPALDTYASFQARNPSFNENLGGGGCETGDVNGDGWPDLLVGSPDYIADGKQDAGRAHVFLGPEFLTDIPLEDPYPETGARLGDHGLLLYDVDRDGRDDVLVGSIRHDQRLADGTIVYDSGRVYSWPANVIVDGTQTALPTLVENPMPEENATFGWAIVADQVIGSRGLLVGAPGSDVVHRLSLPNLVLVETIVAPSPIPPPLNVIGSFGSSLSVGLLGPMDESGLLVTAPASRVTGPGCGLGGMSNAGAAFVLTGPSFQTLAFTLVSPDACDGLKQFFGTRSLAVDLDRDGQEDLVLSDPAKDDSGEVRVFWGADYSTFDTLKPDLGPVLTTGFGNYLAAGDIDADGFDELVVYASMGAGSGGVFVHDWQTLICDVESLSVSTGGDAHFTLDLSPAQASKTYLAALGISGSNPGFVAGKGSYVPLNIDAVTLAGLTLLGSPLFEGFTGTLDAEGQAAMALHFPSGFPSALTGATLTVAAVVIESGGRPGAGSSAVHIVLTP